MDFNLDMLTLQRDGHFARVHDKETRAVNVHPVGQGLVGVAAHSSVQVSKQPGDAQVAQ